MSVAIFQKDPAEKANFSIDYSDLLAEIGGPTIVDSTWIATAGLTVASSTFTTTETTIRTEAGTDGQDYEAVNHVTLSDGQELEKAITIQVRQSEAGSSQDATDRSNALALLLRWIQPHVIPPLKTDQIEAILDSHKVATTYQPNTFYPVGTKILSPLPRVGIWYLVTHPGTSHAAGRAFSAWPTRYGVEFSDGQSDPQLVLEAQDSDAIFRANPSDPSLVNCYDVRGAARECIQLRLQLGSQMIDDGDQLFSQISANLHKLLEQYYPIRFPISVARA